MRSKISENDLTLPMMLLGIMALALGAMAALSLVAEIDREATLHEEALAANGLRGRLTEIGALTPGVVVWDDAVRNLDNRFDPAWAEQNIGLYFWQTDRFSHTFVLDSADRPVFASVAGRQAELGAFTPFAAGAAPLIAGVRDAEARRGVLRPRTGAAPVATAPIMSCGFGAYRGRPVAAHDPLKRGQTPAEPDRQNGGQARDGSEGYADHDATPPLTYIMCATLVASDFGALPLRGRTAPLVVNALPVDDFFLSAFASRFLLRDIGLIPAGQVPPRTAAYVPLCDARGGVLANLRWSPARPGDALFHRLALPLIAVLCALACGQLLLYRRTRRTANELLTSEARATHLAYHDSLTGLPNRVLFCDRLSHALGRLRRTHETVAVFCLDLDRFKMVNDTHGHPAGDELIKTAGRIMVSNCRASETVARMSGDEFAIIMPGASAPAAAALAMRLTQALREPIDLEVGQVFIGCSIGITLVDDGGLQPAEILRQADMALYRAKETAKGAFSFFEPEMDATIKMRRALETDLRGALMSGGLYLVYQPQVNDRKGLTGVEALLRWRHPDLGELSPAFFVAIAEECGLIVELGMFALRRAFEDSKRWTGIKIAVNISPKQIRMKDFADRVIALAEEIGVDPRNFELEITESLLLGDDPETRQMLNKLREHGFELALDDFGTGYSSLSYLQRYPITRIKIDRSFIANLGVGHEAEEFITAIVRLARALRLSVIAEGVETKAQQTYLTAAGCSDMQGYLHGRPMPAADIDAMIQAVPETQAKAESSHVA